MKAISWTAIEIKSLVFLILFVLAIAVIGTSYLFQSEDPSLSISDRTALVPSIVLSLGVLIALATYTSNRQKNIEDKEREQARFLLEYAHSGFDQVVSLLSNHDNDRVVWIRAARILSQSIALKKDIKPPEYLKAYKIEEFKCKSDLFRVLSLYDKTGVYDPLPPQFFYGIPDWDKNRTLDDCALKASREMRSGSVSIDEVVSEPSLREISVHSIVAIYDFIEDREDFDEPLNIDDKNYEWGNSWMLSMGKKQGAMRYVFHRANNYVFNKKLVKRDSSDSTES